MGCVLKEFKKDKKGMGSFTIGSLLGCTNLGVRSRDTGKSKASPVAVGPLPRDDLEQFMIYQLPVFLEGLNLLPEVVDHARLGSSALSPLKR